MRRLLRLAAAGAAALTVAGCNLPSDVGYVEIRTMPRLSATTPPPLYLGTLKLESLKKGTVVLTQRVGTAKLATDGVGGQRAPLCEVVVRKNRITTVTISVLDRPPRCQCQNGGGPNHTCVS